MGLDMYLYTEKRLNKRSKIDKQYIELFDTIDFNTLPPSDNYTIYISQYFSSKSFYDTISSMPPMYGQVGMITEVYSDGDSYIVKTEASYWRKANHIHKWFVDNCQDGIDECQITDVSPAQLESLYNLLDKFGYIPKDIDEDYIPTPYKLKQAQELLPSTSGFFFGNTNYDNSYFYHILTTRNMLAKLLKPSTTKNWKITYSSSW